MDKLSKLMVLTMTVSSVLAVISATIIQSPEDTVYHRGTDINGYVTCIVSTPVTSGLSWIVASGGDTNGIVYTKTYGIYDHAEDKFSINDDATTSGNFTLMIKNMDRGDTGSYSCQYGQATALSAAVTVADPPGVPDMTVPISLIENSTQIFTCTTEGGYPLPNITWALDNTDLPPNDYTTTSNEGRVTSRLTRVLSHEDHEKRLTCEAENILNSEQSEKTLNVQFTPRVRVAPQNLIVMRDESFSLTCDATSNPIRDRLVWKAGSSDVASQVTVHTVSGGIANDTTYSCDVTNSLGPGQGSTKVTVHYAPVVSISQGESLTIRENQDLIITCAVSAKPDASIRWLIGGNEIGDASPELVISSATRQNAGLYRCEARNTPTPTSGPATEKSSNASIQVNIEYPAQVPQISVDPISSSGEYRAGKQIELSCTTTDRGKPESEIKWYRKDRPNSVFTGERFAIAAPQVEDSGLYRCQAENTVNDVSSDSKSVTFIDVPELVIADRRSEVNVSKGVDYQLECSYRGLPAPQIIWNKNNALVDDETQYTIKEETTTEENSKYVKVTSQLKFKGSERSVLMVSDFAEYKCLASNSAGQSEDNFQRRVNVIFAPEFGGFGKVAVNIGAEAVITCPVLSYPAVTEITFWRNGQQISSGDNYQLKDVETEVDGIVYMQQRSLLITSVSGSDYGNYKCRAENSEGIKNTDITLMKTSKPDVPAALSAEPVDWDEAQISWKAGFDGGEAQTFVIVMSSIEGEERKTVDGNSNELVAYSLEGLMPNTEYKVKVYSKNSLGQSQSYAEASFKTDIILIPSPQLRIDESEKMIMVDLNSTEFCAKIQGIKEDTTTDITECELSPSPLSYADLDYSEYKALACVPGREDVCVESPVASAQIDETGNADKIVIIAVVVSIVVVLLILVVVAAICILRRKRQSQKAKTSPKTGQINHIMTPKGVPGEVHYSNNGYQVNSDLELEDEADAVPYGEFRNLQVDSPVSRTAPLQNLDYIYASVQKKPSEQNKLNENAVNAYNLQGGDRMNIHDPSSISDNSDQDQFEVPPSPYRGPDNDLSFLGDGAMGFNRYPSMSESNYSSPDSKQLKKVVYEVIV